MLVSFVIVPVPVMGSDAGTRAHLPKTRGVRKVSMMERVSFAMAVVGCGREGYRVLKSVQSCLAWRGLSGMGEVDIVLDVEDTYVDTMCNETLKDYARNSA